MIIKPTEIEAAAKDITNYWKTSKADKSDKLKILDMLEDHYSLLSVNYEGEALPGVYNSLRLLVRKVIKDNK